MNHLQMFSQLLRPAQETGVEKAESMASHQQTSIQHSLELNMSNGNSLCGSVGTNFSRLTEPLVFAFLGGYVSMDDLPCLGDSVNGIGEFHRTTPVPMNSHSKSSQVESLDLNGNLHQLSAISMDLDFNSGIMEDLRKSVKTSECHQKPVENVSILLDTFGASSTACSPPEHTSQRTDENELLPENSINAHLICNKSAIDILNLEDPSTSLPFQLDDFTGNVFNIINLKFLDFFNFMDSNSDLNSLFKKFTSKLHKINANRTPEIQKCALHNHDLKSGNLESQFHRHHKSSNDFLVTGNISETIFCGTNRSTDDANFFLIPKPGRLMDYLYGDLDIPQFLDAESSSMQSEDLCCTIGNNGEGPTFSVPDPSQFMNFLYGDLESPVFLSSESIEKVVPIHAKHDSNYSKVEVISQSAEPTIEESYQCSPINSWTIQQTISGMMTESLRDSNGFTNGMDFNRVRIPSSSQFGKDSFEISDSKLSYHHLNHFDQVSSKVHNTSATEPKGSFHKNLTTFVPATIPLSYKSEDDKESMKTDPSPFTFNTAVPSLMNKNSTRSSYENPEIYVPSPCCDQKVCLLGYCDSEYDSEVEDLSDCTLNIMFGKLRTYNTLNLPIRSNSCSLAGAFEEKEITPTSSALLECNGEQISSDSSFFDLSDHDDLLEMYELSNQKQYIDIGYSCESPTWPEKMITVSRGQTQKPLTSPITNLTKILTADPFLFHSNTDETSVINKNWKDEIYERNSENSVSLCCLDQMECALETSLFDAGRMDCLPLLHICNDGFEDSIEHQSLQNDENDSKFAFPDPRTLKDFFFGSLDSPKFLASEFLDGKIDTLDYPSLLGDCEQGDRREEADLSDKMIFDQFCQDLSRDDNSINKFSCSIQLLDLISSPFDISNHDELLEWYGINDQDQFMGDDWTCDSPTWPGKMKFPNQNLLAEEASKELDEYCFGAQSVEKGFDRTYMKNFRRMYKEDRWEGYSYRIGKGSFRLL